MSEVTGDERYERDSREAIARRREMAQALAKGGMTGVHVMSREAAREVITPKRHELLRTLRDEDVESVRDLARRVDRDAGQVSRDLTVLAEQGLVFFEEEGAAKRPRLRHDHVVVEPIL